MQFILIDTFSPFPSLSLSLPASTPVSSLSYILSPLCPPSQQSLSTYANAPVSSTSSAPLSSLNSSHVAPLHLRLAVKLVGGKGGFASQLRAQGGRMSSNKATNNDSCRDLNGRRLSTIKEATKLAAYIQAAPDRAAAEAQKAQAKLDALNLEIARLDGATSSKRRLDDNEFVEESREIVEGVKDAVREAMLKKRKKNKEKEKAAAAATATPETVAGSAPVASSSKAAEAEVPAVVEEKENAEVDAEGEVEAEPEPEPEVEETTKKPAAKGKGKGRAKK